MYIALSKTITCPLRLLLTVSFGLMLHGQAVSAEHSVNLLPLLKATSDWEKFNSELEWFDCGEISGQLYCSDLVRYYRAPVYLQAAKVGKQVVRLSLSTDYSVLAYGDLQLNLRRDGFELIRAEKLGAQFDVKMALSRWPAAEADKRLIQFLNQGDRQQMVTLYWQAAIAYPLAFATLTSDGKQITIVLTSTAPQPAGE